MEETLARRSALQLIFWKPSVRPKQLHTIKIRHNHLAPSSPSVSDPLPLVSVLFQAR